MKITKRQLKQLLKEEVSALPLENLVGGIAGLVDGMHPEDVSDVFEKVFRALPGVELQMHDAPPEEEEIESREMIGFGRGEEEESESAGRPIGFREQLEWLILEEINHTLSEVDIAKWLRGRARIDRAGQKDDFMNQYRVVVKTDNGIKVFKERYPDADQAWDYAEKLKRSNQFESGAEFVIQQQEDMPGPGDSIEWKEIGSMY